MKTESTPEPCDTMNVTELQRGMTIKTPKGFQVIRSCAATKNYGLYRLTFDGDNDILFSSHWMNYEVAGNKETK